MHLERRHLRIAYGDSVKPGVVAVPLTAQDEIVLISQFRHAVRLWMLELPRGFGETAAVDRPDLTLGREVLEETGYTALQERYPLGRLVTDSGKLQDMLYLIAVRVQGPPVPRPEEGEVIRQVVTMPFSRLAQACSEGRIVDAFTLAAVARLFPHFEADRFRYGFAPGDDANRCLRHVGE
jgi:ADP-ribose pyrophosphatase